MKFNPPQNKNYCATVVEIKSLIPLENCDKVVGVNLFGFQAIVSKNVQIGDVGVFFPAETQLSEEFCSNNNLFRHSELNVDPNTKGYFEDNRRIKAMKFRGHRSSAFFMPLTAFEYLGVDQAEFTIGDEFDEVNGHDICKKYFVPVRASRGNYQPKTKQYSRVDTAYIPEHFSTDMYFKNSHLVGAEEEIIVTQKLHGCFRSVTSITMADGSRKKIKDIVVGDEVLGYNESTGEIVPTKVLKTAITGTTTEWQKITIQNKNKGDEHVIVCTGNHQIYTLNDGWKEAKDITTEDQLVIQHEREVLDPTRLSILTGILLGDGCLGKNKKFIGYSHKIDHEEYIDYINTSLGNIVHPKKSYAVSGYGTKMVRSATKASWSICEAFSAWSVKPREVPENLTLDPISLAFWYMDDGSLLHNEKQQDRANFAVCAFSDKSVETLVRALKDLGFTNPVYYKDLQGYNRMRLNKDDADKLFSMISDYVPPIMRYKLSEKYRNKEFKGIQVDNRKAQHVMISHIIKSEVVQVNSTYPAQKYDIETETHNFFASRTLVHNSSIRVANTVVKRSHTWKDKLAKLLGVNVQETEFDYVFGSRKVIKDANNPNQQHYYTSDIWTEEGKKLEGLIPENFLVYGELIGFTSSGSPIQGGYTYNLPKGRCKLYVYRIAFVNDRGFVVDLSWNQVKEFCQQRGLEHVPELWRGKHKDFKAEDYLDKVYYPTYKEAVPLSDQKTVDEGICIRVDKMTPYILKSKSPIFYEHETKMLDKGTEDIESITTE